MKAVKVTHTAALRTEATINGGDQPANLCQAFKVTSITYIYHIPPIPSLPNNVTMTSNWYLYIFCHLEILVAVILDFEGILYAHFYRATCSAESYEWDVWCLPDIYEIFGWRWKDICCRGLVVLLAGNHTRLSFPYFLLLFICPWIDAVESSIDYCIFCFVIELIHGLLLDDMIQKPGMVKRMVSKLLWLQSGQHIWCWASRTE